MLGVVDESVLQYSLYPVRDKNVSWGISDPWFEVKVKVPGKSVREVLPVLTEIVAITLRKVLYI